MRWPEQHGDGSTKPFSKRPANAERKTEHGGSAIQKNAGRYFSLRGTLKAIWSPSGLSGFPMCPAKCTLPTKFCPANTTLQSLVVTFETTSSVRPCTHHDVHKGTSHRGSRAQVPINRIRGNFGTSLDGLRTYRDLPANHSDLAIPSCRVSERV